MERTIPNLTLGKDGLVGTIALADWGAWLSSEDEKSRPLPAGTARLNVDQYEAPDTRQATAFHWLIDHQIEVLEAIQEGLLAWFREPKKVARSLGAQFAVPDFQTRAELAAAGNLRLTTVDIHREGLEDGVYVGFRFALSGGTRIGVLTQGLKVVRIGRELVSWDFYRAPAPGAFAATGEETLDELVEAASRFGPGTISDAIVERLRQKEDLQPLGKVERDLVVVWDCSNEIDNGGFDQLFSNSTKRHAPLLVDAYRAIGCEDRASVAAKALRVLWMRRPVTEQGIDKAMGRWSLLRGLRLARCDDAYFSTEGDFEQRVFDYIVRNKEEISLL